MKPIGILKSDQFYALSMRLTELFVAKDNMLVRGIASRMIVTDNENTTYFD